MTEQLKEIGARLAGLRDAMELSVSDLAARLNVTEEEYLKYESGELDFSFSFLYNASQVLGVDVLDIISGESPKLSRFCVVRAGEGFDIQRRAAYDYKHLAYTFREKKAEPFLVTVEPKEQKPTLHSHEGQEFDYMLKGDMSIYLGDQSFVLHEGDSVYYDSSIPHAMNAVGGDAQFLAVVMK
ncbi:MAG: XRE family transcriptional regulator [Clostridiales bacterium]|jgi:transcriptional regulator with XRE-family HTH domain|nr:XRE family transcriptional regulator [Clostridiales bacterium]